MQGAAHVKTERSHNLRPDQKTPRERTLRRTNGFEVASQRRWWRKGGGLRVFFLKKIKETIDKTVPDCLHVCRDF